ncbi:ferritin [Plebeiibacterium marinum]|uniref:Ferritin n=1 Tax=Plebeiibacterium marinum TaxID=2992111 RepID=A0AAE3MHX9_9BACT|nr:ferritin [Plebeiobacterium marinum]MCW3807972.1 ferritin [Plebeiobacterium marinum]
MLKKAVEEILVRQIEREAYSSNLYLAMASWAETNGFGGVSEWMYAQAEEEKIHMLKFMKYVNERGGKAIIPAIEQPPFDFANVQEVFEKTLEHEQFVTESINEIVGVCLEEKDFTTHNWIQWFVTEQIEEEASVSGIIDKLKLLNGQNLYMFDRDVVGMRGAVPGSQQ